jgi:hypothetical protein
MQVFKQLEDGVACHSHYSLLSNLSDTRIIV